MKVTCEHNLPPAELRKALVGIVEHAGLTAEVHEALEKAIIGDLPKAPRHPAMRELVDRFRALYGEAVEWIRDYVDAQLRPGLRKAAGGYLQRPLTKEEIARIRQAIQDRFSFVATQLESVDLHVPADLLERWKRLGLVAHDVTVADLAGTGEKLVRNAFLLGRLWQAVEAGQGYQQVLAAARSLPLWKLDEHVIAVAETQTANYVTALGEGLAKEAAELLAAENRSLIRQMAVDFHRGALTRTVNDLEAKIEEGLPAPERAAETWQQFSSELYHTFQDSRDWDRVAFTELQDARQQGKALALLKEFGPGRLVYKRPMPTACPQCNYLYLKPDGVTPRVFQLQEMMGWGTNHGRKPLPVRGGRVVSHERDDGAETLKPVAGLVHPWCECSGPHPFTGMEPWAKDA